MSKYIEVTSCSECPRRTVQWGPDDNYVMSYCAFNREAHKKAEEIRLGGGKTANSIIPRTKDQPLQTDEEILEIWEKWVVFFHRTYRKLTSIEIPEWCPLLELEKN